MRTALLATYAAMMPRLAARESMRMVYAVRVAQAQERDYEREMRSLRSDAGIPPPLMTPQEIAERAESWGVPVTRVTRG